MTQIFLVRHGQSEGNLFRRVQGQTDVELTADGKAQLPYLTKRFAETPLAAVYTSPLRRAEETAAAIVGGRDIPVFADKRLIEMCFGAWEMRPWGEVNLESPSPSPATAWRSALFWRAFSACRASASSRTSRS